MKALNPESLELLADIAHIAADDFEPSVRGCLKLLRELTGMESTMLLMLDYESEELLQRARYVDVADDNVIPIIEGDVFPWLVGGCRLLRESGRNYSDDMQADYPDFELGVSLGLRAYLSVPIEIGPEHHLVGTLCGMQPDVHSVSAEVVGLARVLAQLIAARFDREARIAEERARTEFTGDLLYTWINRAVEHEHHVRTDLMVVSGIVALARTADPNVDVPELLGTATERLKELERHVDRFIAGLRDSIQSSAQHDNANVAEILREVGGVYSSGEGDQASESGPNEVWVRARPDAIRSLLRLLLSGAVADERSLEFREEPGTVLITAMGPLQLVSMSVLRALVTGLNGEISLETMSDGDGRIEIALPTVPAPVRL